jgi:hypothetical protein
MDPLAEARAVALMLQHTDGFVHVYADGSANWSPEKPEAAAWHFAEDVPEGVPVRRFSYQQARTEYRNALKRLRNRGVLDVGA